MQGDVLGIIKNRPGNLIINGAFEFNQRFGTGINTTPGTYGLDRWVDSSNATSQRVSVTGERFEFARQGVATASANNMTQRIESKMVKHLRGKQVTFSILLKLVSGSLGGLPHINVQYANVKDTFSAVTSVVNADLDSDAPIDSTFRKFQKTFTVTNEMADNGFQIQIGDVSSGTNTIQFAQAMLNEGPVAAAFERAGVNYANEQQLCQRYYEKSYDVDVPPGTGGANGALIVAGRYSTSNDIFYPHRFGQVKRVIPSIVTYEYATGVNTGVIVPNSIGTMGCTWGGSASSYGFHYIADAEL